MIGLSIIAGLFLFATLLLFFSLRIRFHFVGAKKDSLIEIRFFKWTLFSTNKKESINNSTEEKSSYNSETRETLKSKTSNADFYDDDLEDVTESKIENEISKSDVEASKTSEANEDAVASEKNTETQTEISKTTDANIDAADSNENEVVISKEETSDTSQADIDDITSEESAEFKTEADTNATIETSIDDDTLQEDSKKSKKTRELTEKEFLTLMFNPKLHSMVLRMVWRLLRRTWRLFQIRFENVVVQGIRMEYDEMGAFAAISSFTTSQVNFLKNWEFQMDWLKEKNPEIRGTLLIQFRLFYFLLWSLIALFYVARVYFWYRRNKKRFIENPIPFRLVFWRRKIIDLIAAED